MGTTSGETGISASFVEPGRGHFIVPRQCFFFLYPGLRESCESSEARGTCADPQSEIEFSQPDRRVSISALPFSAPSPRTFTAADVSRSPNRSIPTFGKKKRCHANWFGTPVPCGDIFISTTKTKKTRQCFHRYQSSVLPLHRTPRRTVTETSLFCPLLIRLAQATTAEYCYRNRLDWHNTRDMREKPCLRSGSPMSGTVFRSWISTSNKANLHSETVY